MGKGKSSTPSYSQSASQALTTAQQQQQLNEGTAQFNAALNNVNQSNPYGTLNYAYSKDAQGNPITTATTTLSPTEQTIFNQSQANATQAGSLAGNVLSNSSSAISTPIDYSKFTAIPDSGSLQDQQQSSVNAQLALLNPQFAQQQSQLESQLASQGITAGSTAYNNAYNNYNNLKSQTLDQATLNSAQYASQEQATALAARDQQINEATQAQQLPLSNYAALTGQSGVTLPTFQSPTNNDATAPNYESDVSSAYQAAVNAANAKSASSNSLFGSLIGGAATLGGAYLTGGTSLFGSGLTGALGGSALSNGAVNLAAGGKIY